MNRFPHRRIKMSHLIWIGFALAFIAAIISAPSVKAAGHNYLIYIGTYTGADSKGIYAYRFDAESGALTPIGLVAETESPSFLAAHPSGKFLYAVNEIDQFHGEKVGSVSGFAIDPHTGKLTLLNRVSSLGDGPAHLSLDKTGKYVFVANYGGGSVAAFPIQDDGSLGKASSFIQHTGSSVDRERQAGPHAHEIVATNDNRFALVPDLGLDKVLIYRFDASTGKLTANDPAFAGTDPGAGPRHVALHPNGRFAYLANEMQSTVTTFAYDAHAGRLRPIQTLRTVSDDFKAHNDTAEIATDARGKFLYVSNRGHDSIVVYSINSANGTLSQIQDIATGGKTPRDFAVDPTGAWLFAANQESNNITLFRIDPGTGHLTRTQTELKIAAPVCVTFVTVP